jgi:hypothetical protein
MIFYNFLYILQKSATLQPLFKIQLLKGSLERFETLQKCPRFALKPLNRIKPTQLGPWPKGQRGSPEFGEAGGGDSRGRGGGGVWAHQ